MCVYVFERKDVSCIASNVILSCCIIDARLFPSTNSPVFPIMLMLYKWIETNEYYRVLWTATFLFDSDDDRIVGKGLLMLKL